jgi:hypothetical protein
MELSMRVAYRYYIQQPLSVVTAVEEHSYPVVHAAPTGGRTAQGRQVLDRPYDTQQQEFSAAAAFGISELPDTSCSRQWSISIELKFPPELLAPPAGGRVRLVQLFAVGAAATAADNSLDGWLVVNLQVSGEGSTALMLHLNHAAPRQLDIQAVAGAATHLLVVRDGPRVGMWLDGQGGWLLRNIWCPPDASHVTYCTRPRELREQDIAFTSLRWVLHI